MAYKSQVKLYELDRTYDYGDLLDGGGCNSSRRRKKFVKRRARKRLRKQLHPSKLIKEYYA